MPRGEQRMVISSSAGGSMFSTGGKKAKQHVGIDFTPEAAFGLTGALIVGTFVLHIIGRFIH